MNDLEPGPELDALVARLVMRWHEWLGFEAGEDYEGQYPMFLTQDDFGCQVWMDEDEHDIGVCRPWFPSTSIADAWEVVEQIVGDGSKASFDLEWNASAYPTRPFYLAFRVKNQTFTGRSTTAPHAICLAALKAVS